MVTVRESDWSKRASEGGKKYSEYLRSGLETYPFDPLLTLRLREFVTSDDVTPRGVFIRILYIGRMKKRMAQWRRSLPMQLSADSFNWRQRAQEGYMP